MCAVTSLLFLGSRFPGLRLNCCWFQPPVLSRFASPTAGWEPPGLGSPKRDLELPAAARDAQGFSCRAKSPGQAERSSIQPSSCLPPAVPGPVPGAGPALPGWLRSPCYL